MGVEKLEMCVYSVFGTCVSSSFNHAFVALGRTSDIRRLFSRINSLQML